MERSLAITLLACLALIAGVASDATVSMEITQTHAKKGENVTIMCELSNMPPGAPIMYLKKVVEVNGDIIEEAIAGNDFLVPKYKDAGRFRYELTNAGDSQLMNLAMTNVNNEDTARYQCGVTGDENRATRTFEVYRAPEEFVFNINGTGVNENDMIDMTVGEKIPFGCSAFRSMTYPKLHINVGVHDITKLFTYRHHPVAACENSDDCLLHFHYDASLEHDYFEPKWEYNGKLAVCKGFVNETEYKRVMVKETAVRLNVTHVPVVNCTKGTYLAEIGSKLTIQCDLNSNPAIVSQVLFYSDDENLKLSPGESSDGVEFLYQASHDVFKPGKLTITFPDVLFKHFQIYKFKAENELGSVTHKFSVKEDTGSNPPPGSASVNTISFFSFLLVTVVTLLFSH